MWLKPRTLPRSLARVFASLSAACILLLAQAAYGVEGQSSDPPPMQWYGWQSLAVDASIGSLVALSFLSGDFATQVVAAVAGSIGYLVSGPLVHTLNESQGKPSLLLRSMSVLIGAIIGYLSVATACYQDPCGVDPWTGLGVGLMLGAGGAIVIDATALGWKRRTSSR